MAQGVPGPRTGPLETLRTLDDGSFRCIPVEFVRCDANGDGEEDLSDAVSILRCPSPNSNCFGCDDAADCDDNGIVDRNDAIDILRCLFGLSTCPPPPFPDCGMDTTDDTLGCDNYDACP